KEVRLYVNGKLQSEGKTGYSGKTIDLGMRGLFATDPVTYPSLNGARQFFIGYSYDKERPLNGLISEVRVWNTVRTPEQIWKYMYDVEPTTEGLCAYWKFNEGEGNVVVDQTGHGNDAVSNIDLKWDNTIEIPQLNAE
ncbi:MAG: LamG-like jellyroll fold domain-containing protein, partial [Alistipes sp.]